ncbi:MAG: hypothetical protein P8184_10185, partial [Calditrichia bacterium]
GEVWNDMKISGTVKNIVSQQKVIGQPTTIDINGTRRDQASVRLSGVLDYLEEKPREKIELNLSRMPLSNVKLTDFALLPYKINHGSGQTDAVMQFDGNDFATNIKFEASSLKFDFSEKPANMNQRLLEISRSIVSAIQTIDFTAVARQVDGKFGFSINSNLDNLIAGKMKDIVSGEVVKARDQLQQRVQQQVERYRSETDKLIAAQRQELENRLQQVQEQIQKQQAELEKKRKEIESRIEQTKKDLQKKLEEETKNRLKDIFKK